MKRKWFKWVRSIENAKERWYKLSLQYHPDRPGGSHIIMTEVNAEYKQILVELQTPKKPVTAIVLATMPLFSEEPDTENIPAPEIMAEPVKEKFLKKEHTAVLKTNFRSIALTFIDALADSLEKNYLNKK